MGVEEAFTQSKEEGERDTDKWDPHFIVSSHPIPIDSSNQTQKQDETNPKN
jgi:hypothetical protein